jgi:hypothetical protein
MFGGQSLNYSNGSHINNARAICSQVGNQYRILGQLLRIATQQIKNIYRHSLTEGFPRENLLARKALYPFIKWRHSISLNLHQLNLCRE